MSSSDIRSISSRIFPGQQIKVMDLSRAKKENNEKKRGSGTVSFSDFLKRQLGRHR